ncbi:MAG: phage head spike fiber domain-containing protein, partial [Bdellovibrionota bacterium]
GTLPSGLTFSRASSATYFDSSGVMQTAASGAPRFDHDPGSCAGTCAARGLLLEEARTNLLLESSAFDSTWTTSNASVSADVTTSPTGSTDADTISSGTTTTTNSDHVEQSVTLLASTPYTLSFFVKGSTSTQSRMELSAFNSGTSGKTSTLTWSGGVPSASAGTVDTVGNGWYRVHLSFVSNASDAGTATIAFYPADSAADTNGAVQLWGAQLEAGAVVSSYIPTAGSTATRSAEGVSIDNFSNWFNASAWTAILDFNRPSYEANSVSKIPTLFSACDATSGITCSASHFEANFSTTGNTFSGTSYVASANIANSTYTNAAILDGVTVQMAVSQSSAGELRTVVNGTAATLSGTASMPTLNAFILGASGRSGAYANQLQGYLRKFTYRARALTSAQMQAMTSD